MSAGSALDPPENKADRAPSPVSSPPTATSNGTPKPSPPKSSFLSKLLKLIPCVTPSTRAHPIELLESQPNEKLPAVEPPPTSAASPEPVASAVDTKPDSDTNRLSITVPGVAVDELMTPPTPVSLLPQDETEGLTSGSVQAPGSTGESALHPHHPHTPSKRDSVVHVTGDEDTDASFTDEEELDDLNALENEQDEEDRLILNGGAGIPIGPDGMPKPLLPPISPQHVGRKCLVLDLDETLVHSSFKSIQQADYVVPVEIEFNWHNVYVIKRPGVDNFLKKMGEIYEVVVFTASLSKYADPVLDKLDIHQVVSHRLFRESCYNHKGNYVKDLSQLGRPIGDTIIIDNSPASYIFHPNNSVPVSSWFTDPHDTELTDLVPFLADLAEVADVRMVLDGGQ